MTDLKKAFEHTLTSLRNDVENDDKQIRRSGGATLRGAQGNTAKAGLCKFVY